MKIQLAILRNNLWRDLSKCLCVRDFRSAENEKKIRFINGLSQHRRLIDRLFNLISFSSNLSSVSGHQPSRYEWTPTSTYLCIRWQCPHAPPLTLSLLWSATIVGKRKHYLSSTILIDAIKPFAFATTLSFIHAILRRSSLFRRTDSASHLKFPESQISTTVSLAFLKTMSWIFHANVRQASNKKCQLTVCQKEIV